MFFFPLPSSIGIRQATRYHWGILGIILIILAVSGGIRNAENERQAALDAKAAHASHIKALKHKQKPDQLNDQGLTELQVKTYNEVFGKNDKFYPAGTLPKVAHDKLGYTKAQIDEANRAFNANLPWVPLN